LSYTSDSRFTNRSAVYIYRKSLGPVHSRPSFFALRAPDFQTQNAKRIALWGDPLSTLILLGGVRTV
jgi:hypothetical protein